MLDRIKMIKRKMDESFRTAVQCPGCFQTTGKRFYKKNGNFLLQACFVSAGYGGSEL